MTELKTLAGSVAGLGGEVEYQAAQSSVLLCAVAALVRAHPAPEIFAAEFRRAWQLAGSQHSNGANDSPVQAGIEVALETLEEACVVPLNVRPPQG